MKNGSLTANMAETLMVPGLKKKKEIRGGVPCSANNGFQSCYGCWLGHCVKFKEIAGTSKIFHEISRAFHEILQSSIKFHGTL